MKLKNLSKIERQRIRMKYYYDWYDDRLKGMGLKKHFYDERVVTASFHEHYFEKFIPHSHDDLCKHFLNSRICFYELSRTTTQIK